LAPPLVSLSERMICAIRNIRFDCSSVPSIQNQ
jgi:hypothetical protein